MSYNLASDTFNKNVHTCFWGINHCTELSQGHNCCFLHNSLIMTSLMISKPYYINRVKRILWYGLVSFTTNSLEKIKCMSGCPGCLWPFRTPEHPEETHADRERTCQLPTERPQLSRMGSNTGSSWDVVNHWSTM